ncbi:MAG: hypothetical protein LBT66_04675 [Methanobrevibacter sp.]|jgi:hypothetical protein|nr:hypothetical protein [Candidatus Methanovirga meridionalis]
MNYILTLKENDIKYINNEEVIEKEDINEQRLSIIEDENTIQFISEPDEIDNNKMEELIMLSHTNNAFKNIILNKTTKEIDNINEIMECWKKTKYKILYDPTYDESIADIIMYLSNIFEDEGYVSEALKNYWLLPFFNDLNLNELEKNDIETKLKIFGLLARGYVEYNVKYSSKIIYDDVEKTKITFSGKGDTKTVGLSLENELRKIIVLPKEKKFFVNTSIEGTYIFSNGLETFDSKISFFAEEMRDLKRYKFAEKNIFINVKRQ